MTLMTDPKFLHLAMKAQADFGKSRRIDDEHSLKGTFAVFEMLDMLDADMDARTPTDKETDG